MAWDLMQRLLALRMPPMDRDSLADLEKAQQTTRILNWSSTCAPSGSSLFNIAHVPHVWSTLSKVEQRTPNGQANLKCKEAWDAEPQEVKDHFAAQTIKVRAGDLEAIYEVLDRYKAHRKSKTETPVAANQNRSAKSPKGPMSLLRRTELIQLVSFDAGTLVGLDQRQQDTRVTTWTSNTISITGKTLFALKVAPDYEYVVSTLGKSPKPSSYVNSRWLKLSGDEQTKYAVASAQLWTGGLATLLQVMAQMVGPLPDLTSLRRTEPRDIPHAADASIPPPTARPADIPMALSDRLLLAEVASYDPEALSRMSKEQQDAFVLTWSRANIHHSGRTLFALKKAPKYMQLSDDRRSKETLMERSMDSWGMMVPTDKNRFKAAASMIRRTGCALQTFVQVMTKTLGPLPDLVSYSDIGNGDSPPSPSVLPDATTSAKTPVLRSKTQNLGPLPDLAPFSGLVKVRLPPSPSKVPNTQPRYPELHGQNKNTGEDGQSFLAALTAAAENCARRISNPVKSSKRVDSAIGIGTPSHYFGFQSESTSSPGSAIGSSTSAHYFSVQSEPNNSVDSAIGSSASSHYSNAKSELDPRIDTPQCEGTLPNRGAWASHSEAYSKLTPIRIDEACDVIEVVYASIQARYRQVKSGDTGNLLHLEKYLDRLGDCFKDEHATSEQYHDWIESVLYQVEADHNPDGLL